MRDIDCNADDEYLTLSTNIDDENADGYRLVVFARNMRDGEIYPINGFSINKESPIETKPVEDVRMPELDGMTTEQAIATLEEAGLGHKIRYVFSNEDKGTVLYCTAPYYLPDCEIPPEGYLVSKGANLKLSVSGGTDDPSLYFDPNKDEGEIMGLTIPIPDGLSGPFSFDVDVEGSLYEWTLYGDIINDIIGKKEFVLPMIGSGKKTAKVTGMYYGDVYPMPTDELRFDYATYEVDFDAHAYTLVGEVTEGTFKAKSKAEELIKSREQ